MRFREIPSVARLIEELYGEQRVRKLTPFEPESVLIVVGFALALEAENEDLRTRLGMQSREEPT